MDASYDASRRLMDAVSKAGDDLDAAIALGETICKFILIFNYFSLLIQKRNHQVIIQILKNYKYNFILSILYNYLNIF